jgi:hypothetical protein
MVSLIPEEAGYRCGNAECGASLLKCKNFALEDICNRCVETPPELVSVSSKDSASGEDSPAGETADLSSTTPHDFLCDYCRYTETIPDLSVEGNRQRWYRLEVAKRRLLYSLDLLGLPYGSEASGFPLPLSFDFKTDVLNSDHVWQTMGDDEQVYTGHAQGKITINVREADDVERERLRVDFGEAHRTLIGHFRHEIGHYYWQLLVENQREDEYRELFGDHTARAYGEAMARYYAEGPRPDWHRTYISAYASMHPWEDFAESFATFLDMVSVLDTAKNMGLGCPEIDAEFEPMVEYYRDLGIVLNEMNRAMGLIDLVPEIFTPPTLRKMKFVHDLVRKSRAEHAVTSRMSENP